MTLFRASLAVIAIAVAAAACSTRSAGSPALVCPNGQAACGPQCIDVTRSPANCGGCGIPCVAGQTCQAGVCACASGPSACDGTCAAADAGVDASCGSETLPMLVTSAAGAYWQTGGQLTAGVTGSPDVTVDDTATAQTWEGFGGAFNERGWSYLSMLSDADRQRAIELLYGADGARFAFGRIPIGASDYAMDRYTDDEVPSGTDVMLANFSIDRDLMYLIPYVKAAQAVKANLRLWASPWTPPTWM